MMAEAIPRMRAAVMVCVIAWMGDAQLDTNPTATQ